MSELHYIPGDRVKARLRLKLNGVYVDPGSILFSLFLWTNRQSDKIELGRNESGFYGGCSASDGIVIVDALASPRWWGGDLHYEAFLVDGTPLAVEAQGRKDGSAETTGEDVYYTQGNDIKVRVSMVKDGEVVSPDLVPFEIRLWTNSKTLAITCGYDGDAYYGCIVENNSVVVVARSPQGWWSGKLYGEAVLVYPDAQMPDKRYRVLVPIALSQESLSEAAGIITHAVYGYSAYEIAVMRGYVGSEAEWIASLKGERGYSAYEIAVQNGYTGSEKEWVDSLAAMVHADIDISHISEVAPEGESPTISVSVEGPNTYRQLHFIAKYLKGDKGDKSVTRMTIRQYNALKEASMLDQERWYFVTSNTDAMRYIYAGDTLVAKSDKTGNIFPVTFPLTFSN